MFHRELWILSVCDPRNTRRTRLIKSTRWPSGPIRLPTCGRKGLPRRENATLRRGRGPLRLQSRASIFRGLQGQILRPVFSRLRSRQAALKEVHRYEVHGLRF